MRPKAAINGGLPVLQAQAFLEKTVLAIARCDVLPNRCDDVPQQKRSQSEFRWCQGTLRTHHGNCHHEGPVGQMRISERLCPNADELFEDFTWKAIFKNCCLVQMSAFIYHPQNWVVSPGDATEVHDVHLDSISELSIPHIGYSCRRRSCRCSCALA